MTFTAACVFLPSGCHLPSVDYFFFYIFMFQKSPTALLRVFICLFSSVFIDLLIYFIIFLNFVLHFTWLLIYLTSIFYIFHNSYSFFYLCYTSCFFFSYSTFLNFILRVLFHPFLWVCAASQVINFRCVGLPISGSVHRLASSPSVCPSPPLPPLPLNSSPSSSCVCMRGGGGWARLYACLFVCFLSAVLIFTACTFILFWFVILKFPRILATHSFVTPCYLPPPPPPLFVSPAVTCGGTEICTRPADQQGPPQHPSLVCLAAGS